MPDSSDESSSSDSSDNEEDEEEAAVGVIEWRPTGPQCALGDWEKYTTVWWTLTNHLIMKLKLLFFRNCAFACLLTGNRIQAASEDGLCGRVGDNYAVCTVEPF